MKKFVFSPSQNLIYPVEMKNEYVSAGSWPADGVEISDEMGIEFITQSPAGKVRVVNDGLPAWGDIPPLTHKEEVAVANDKKQRLINDANVYMNGKQWPGKAAMSRLKPGEAVQYNYWLDYLDELEAVDTSPAPDIEWPEKPSA